MNSGFLIFLIILIVIFIMLYLAYRNRTHFYSKNYTSLVKDKDDALKIAIWAIAIIILLCLFIQKKRYENVREDSDESGK